MSNDTIAALEREIDQAKEALDLGECLNRLRNNRDFKRVIVEGYFTHEAVRLVMVKAEPAMQQEKFQTSIIQQIDAIGVLHGYFLKLMQQAELAGAKIENDQATIEEIAEEELQ